VTFVAATLNDEEHADIGDPRKGKYTVAFPCEPGERVRELVNNLTVLGIVPRATVYYDEYAVVVKVTVNIYTNTDHRLLFEKTKDGLEPGTSRRLDDLVLARSRLPDEIRENIYRSADGGRTPAQIAARMNELGIVAGMGKSWTPQKISKIMKERKTAVEAAA
jgi:hypothetical protein